MKELEFVMHLVDMRYNGILYCFMFGFKNMFNYYKYLCKNTKIFLTVFFFFVLVYLIKMIDFCLLKSFIY